MKRDEVLFLEDILENIKDIKFFTTNLSKEDFLKNKEKQNAVIRSLEIIGEAVKNLSKELKQKYPEIKWKNIAGSRDIFIHAYFGVNINRIWNIIKEDLPKLKKEIEYILKNKKSNQKLS